MVALRTAGAVDGIAVETDSAGTAEAAGGLPTSGGRPRIATVALAPSPRPLNAPTEVAASSMRGGDLAGERVEVVLFTVLGGV